MILEVNGISFDYKSSKVLKNIKFKLTSNEVLSILGPNGVGKTTLLKCLNAILRPKAGAIFIEHKNILKLNQMQIARRLGYVAQRVETGRLTAFDAIMLGRRPHIRWDITKNDIRIVHAAITRLHLEKLSLRYIDEMSGGELQKVNIARAIVQEPKILLLDEPTSNLDLKNQFEILNIIKRVVQQHKVSAIMSMHDLNLSLRYSDKFVFLKNGSIFAAGNIEEITSNMIKSVYGIPVVIERYSGMPIIVPVP